MSDDDFERLTELFRKTESNQFDATNNCFKFHPTADYLSIQTSFCFVLADDFGDKSEIYEINFDVKPEDWI